MAPIVCSRFVRIPSARVLYALLGLFCLGVSGCAAGSASVDWVGKPAPFTRYMKADGSYLVTDDLKGKQTVVVYWAAWCSKSRQLIKELDSYAAQRAGAGKEISVLAMSIDKAEDYPRVQSTIADLELKNVSHGYSANDVYDESYIAYGAGSLPYLVVLDPAGTVIAEGHKMANITEVLGPA